MGKKSAYSCLLAVDADGDEFWKLTKYSVPDFEVVGSYDVYETPQGQMICSCPARTQICRHLHIVEKSAEAIAGADEVYNLLQEENPGKLILMETDAKMFQWVASDIDVEDV